MMTDFLKGSRLLPVLAANTREAVSSLRRARLRTILGLVGIMIGISSVIAMVSLGEIAKEQARKEFEALGTDVMLVRTAPQFMDPNAAEISLADASALAASVSSITEAAPRIRGHGESWYAGKKVGQGSIQGVTEAYLGVNRLSLQDGRFISDLDIDRSFCVIGANIADKMRQDGTAEPVGRIIEVNGLLFTVVGILDPAVENYALPIQVDANEAVFVPITTARRAVSPPEIDVIIARSRAGVHHMAAVADVQLFFRERSPKVKLDILTAKELIAQMEAQMGIFTLLLAAVGSISLIVGGIGIMNIMLVSVAERRREIAIRRALGARRQDIQSQFLIESIILTLAGGILGILLGLAVTWGICQFTDWNFLISGVSVISGLSTAVAVGLFFGFQPARQASRLDPIAGLQDE